MKRQQKSTFTSEKDEILIEFVRENEALYDFSHKRYSDSMYKNTLWNIIGEKLQQGGQQCKHRWESIRGQYRKVIKSKKTTTGQPADMRSKWKYEDQLEFLRYHMKDKQRLTSVENETLSVVMDDEEESLSQDADMSDPDNPHMSEVSTVDIPSEEMPKKRNPIKKKTNKHNLTHQTASGTLMKYLLEEETKKSEEKDELDHFFDSIKATVKKFSPADKHLAKNRIFMTVSDIEGKYIGQQLPLHIPTYSTYSHSNIQQNIQSQVNSQFQQFQDQPLLSSTHSYVSASAIPMPSRPPSRLSVPQSSSASSYYENLSSTDNDD